MKSFWKFLDRLATAGLVVAGLGLLWTPTSSGDDIGLFGFGEWTVVTVNGPVQTKAGDNTWNNWAVAKRGTRVSVYGSVKTGRGASATLARGKDRMVVSPNSRITIAPVGPSPASLNETPVTILQSTGRALYNVQTRPSRRFQVLTPFLVAGVKGTTFSVDVSTAGASVSVSEGTVSVSPSAGGEGVDVSIGMTAAVSAAPGSGVSVAPTTAAPPAPPPPPGPPATASAPGTARTGNPCRHGAARRLGRQCCSRRCRRGQRSGTGQRRWQ